MAHDVVGIGEAMLRLSVRRGARLESTQHLDVSVAGAEANVAMAAARMGLDAAFVSALPDSPLGRRAAAEVAGHGVDVSAVVWRDDSRMGTYYVEEGAAPRPTRVVYDRAASAASSLTVAEVPWDLVEGATLVHLSGITPALSPSCREVAYEVVSRAPAVCFDVNYRALLWTPEEAAEVLRDLGRGVDILICTREDAAGVFGLDGDDADLVAGLEKTFAAEAVVLTAGSDGAIWSADGESGALPGYRVDIVDRIGAGDAFAAGVIWGHRDGDLALGVARGLAMAALKMGMHGDQLRATREEVEAVLAGTGREVAR